MNEEAVKGGEAGVYVCVCVCVKSQVFYQLSENIQQFIVSFTRSLYSRQNRLTHTDQLWSKNVFFASGKKKLNQKSKNHTDVLALLCMTVIF